MIEHIISTERGGFGLDGWIRNVCSCGWAGRTFHAHDDYQHTNATAEKHRHLSGDAL